MFLAGVGATAATATGIGSVSAQSSGLDYSSDFSHESIMTGSTTIASINRAEDMGGFDYEADSGDVKNLGETHGLTLAPRPDTDDGEVVAHNPVSFALPDVSGDVLTQFPRETYELDADGNEDTSLPVNWINSKYWSTTTGATITEETESLVVDATDATATFAQSQFEIVEDERKRVLSMIVDVDSLGAGAVAKIQAVDSSGTGTTAEVRIDDGGDPAAEDVVATTTGTGILYQVPLGNIEPGVEAIDQVVVDVTGSATLTFHGLSLDRTSEWVLGEREYIEVADDGSESVETEEVTEDTGGGVSITSFSTIGSVFGASTFQNVTFDFEQRARDLPADLSATGRTDTPETYSYEDRYTIGNTHELPAAFDLTHNAQSLVLEGAIPSERYLNLGYSSPAGTDVETIEDYRDVTITDVSGNVSPGVDDPELELTTAIVGTDGVDVVIDLLLSPDETKELTSGGGGVAVGASGGGGGGFLTPIRSTIMILATVVGGWLAYARNSVSG